MSSPWDAYYRVAIELWQKEPRPTIVKTIKAGETGCCSCGYIGAKFMFYHGRQNEQRLCPNCGADMLANGYIDGDRIRNIIDKALKANGAVA